MDLEFATVDEILEELRERGMRFVFIGEPNTNVRSAQRTIVAAQAADQKDLCRLFRIGIDELRQRTPDPIEPPLE